MARSFNGTSDYISAAHNSAIDMGTSDFTIAFTLKSSTAPSEDDRLFCKGNSSGGTGGGIRYEAGYAAPNLFFVIDDNVTKTAADYGTITDLSDGNPHVWIFERDYGTHLKIFEDGNTQRATISDGTGNINVAETLLIGAGRLSGDTITGFWPGQISEFAIWKRLLTGSEKDMIGKGFSPIFLPKSRVFYAPFIRNTNDYHGTALTATGTTVANHNKIIRTAESLNIGVPQAAISNTGAAMYHHLRTMGVYG